MCICATVTAIDNDVRVHVLQHPRERHHPIGTARLLRLGLDSVRVHVLDLNGTGGASRPVKLPPGAGLLYPSADALDLSTLSPRERPRDLVVLDGTWNHAHQIHRDNPWVAALPCYRLGPHGGSRYRIRAEPRLECLSTVESVVAALRCLQPDLAGTDSLLVAFDAMIDAQIDAQAEASDRPPAHSPRKPRQKITEVVPKLLQGPAAEIVVVYTELGPTARIPDASRRGPLRISAMSLDGARSFDRMVRTPRAPDAFQTARMELAPDAFAHARPEAEVVSAFEAFCGDGPVLVTWEPRVLRWLQTGPLHGPAVLLKGVWGNVSGERVPSLETLIDTLGVDLPEGPVSGRAGHRLMLASAMTHHLRTIDPAGA